MLVGDLDDSWPHRLHLSLLLLLGCNTLVFSRRRTNLLRSISPVYLIVPSLESILDTGIWGCWLLWLGQINIFTKGRGHVCSFAFTLALADCHINIRQSEFDACWGLRYEWA